ncbi:MAG TPA: hypothetical protein EYH38_05895 [Leucothrix sp.]|nr:hypothetical protein [Leucothrix sp.]
MKSGKQRRLEIKEKRRKKAKIYAEIDTTDISNMPSGAIKSNYNNLDHNNIYDLLPKFYVDKSYSCKDCGSNEIWTAKQQRWWYETAKGHINSTAVRCRRCRNIIKEQKQEQKKHMKKMAQRVPHPNEAFFKKKI